MTTATIALTTKISGNAPGSVDIITRARQGDADALVNVFEDAFYRVFYNDVYQHVFLATRNRRQADRITRDTLEQLPLLLRLGRYQSVDDLRASLVRKADGCLNERSRSGASAGTVARARAMMRHVVLMTAAAISATGVLLLVL